MAGRPKNIPQQPALEPPDPHGRRAAKEAEQEAAQDANALVVGQQNQRVAALAQQLNYNGSTDPAVLENSAKDAIRRIGMGIFELGAYLLLLKEACEYGKFMPTLERLNLGVDAAGRYMAVTRRFANSATSRNLEAAGMSKLVELLPLDDEQVKDLTELGQTGELALDDVARMSVKELRAKVRELRHEAATTQEVLDKKNQRIDKLEREKGRIARLPQDKALAATKTEADEILGFAIGHIRGNFRQALVTLAGLGETVFMAGMVGQVQAELVALRDEFHLTDVVGDGTPEWKRWNREQGVEVPDAPGQAPIPTFPQRGKEK